MKPTTILALILLSLPVFAFQVEPYESLNITEAEFNQYHTAISKELAASHRSYPNHFLEVFSDESTRATIAFTLPRHPAHPAWVTRQVVMSEQGVHVAVIGYFAGNEAEFAKLFRQYRAMAEQTQREFNR